MHPAVSSLRESMSTVRSLVWVGLVWTAAALRTLSGRLWQSLRTVWRRLRSLAASVRTRGRRVFDGPVKRAVSGPIRTGLFGRRLDVSLLAVVVAPVLALGTAWWVGSTVGYAALEQWVRGTWHGTNPSLAVFLAVTLLFGIGVVSAALNSGLLPTAALVAAPIFGATVTRYGTEVTYSWGTTVVSLPNAVGIATLFALGFGLPLAVCCLLVGTAIRRIVTVLGPRSTPPSSADEV